MDLHNHVSFILLDGFSRVTLTTYKAVPLNKSRDGNTKNRTRGRQGEVLPCAMPPLLYIFERRKINRGLQY